MEFYKAADGWRWKLTATNGRRVAASSEAFHSEGNARQNAQITAWYLEAWIDHGDIAPHTREPS